MIGVEVSVEIHHLNRQGLNKSQIARRLGIDRKTVAKHLKIPRDKLNRIISKASILDPYKPYLQYRLNEYPELTAVQLCREIATLSCPGKSDGGFMPQSPYQGSEKTVNRYLNTIRPHYIRTYHPVETLPGEQAQADWGYMGFINEDGNKSRLYVFSFLLSHSRARYVEFTTRQDVLTLIKCLQNAFYYVGGMPRVVLFDNAKTVVTERVGSVIKFNHDLMTFALQWKFKPDACWMRSPESKGKVESTIKYVKKNFFYGRAVKDLATLNIEALQWCDEVANEKQHRTVGEIPLDRLAEERKALQPVPSSPQKVFAQITRHVRKDLTFTFETNQYTVPAPHFQKTVTLNVYPNSLEVFVGNDLIAVHERSTKRGQLIVGEGHVDDRPYEKRRRRSALQIAFENLGPVAPSYLKGLARNRQKNMSEQARGILGLADQYGKDLVHAAMSRADGFGNYSFQAVKRIIETQLVNPEALPHDPYLLEEDAYSGPTIDVQKRSLDELLKQLEVASDD